jgi:transposase
MARSHVFLELGEDDAAAVKSFVKEATSHRQRTRAQAVWFSAQGRTVQEITQLLSVTERGVRKWFTAYRRGGLAALRNKAYPRRRTRLSPQQEEQLVAITRQAPSTAGLQGTTWNCRLLRDWLAQTFHVQLSQEWVRCILRQHGLRFRRPKLTLTSPDPDYAQKKGRLTA